MFMIDVPPVEVAIMNYDRKNIEHIYRWCVIAHDFDVIRLKRDIASGEPLARVWNKETKEWEIVKSITPEYLLKEAAEARKNIDDGFREKDLVGLRYVQKDKIEQFGLELSEEEIAIFNQLIELELGADAPKVRLLP